MTLHNGTQDYDTQHNRLIALYFKWHRAECDHVAYCYAECCSGLKLQQNFCCTDL